MNVNDDVVRLKLSSSVLNEIEKLLKLNSIPIDEDTLTKKFYMLTENELIVLQENVANEVVLPTLLELLEKVSHLEKYSSCSIKGNNCEYDLFVQYAYKVNTVSQERYIHIKNLSLKI